MFEDEEDGEDDADEASGGEDDDDVDSEDDVANEDEVPSDEEGEEDEYGEVKETTTPLLLSTGRSRGEACNVSALEYIFVSFTNLIGVQTHRSTEQ